MSSTARPCDRASRIRSQIAAWAPTSTPAGRVGGEQHVRVGAHLAADDELLLVATGQRGGEHVDGRRAYVVGVDDPLGVLLRALEVEQRAAGVGRLGLVAEHPVLPQRRLEQQPVPGAVLGDVGDAALAAAAGRPAP